MYVPDCRGRILCDPNATNGEGRILCGPYGKPLLPGWLDFLQRSGIATRAVPFLNLPKDTGVQNSPAYTTGQNPPSMFTAVPVM